MVLPLCVVHLVVCEERLPGAGTALISCCNLCGNLVLHPTGFEALEAGRDAERRKGQPAAPGARLAGEASAMVGQRLDPQHHRGPMHVHLTGEVARCYQPPTTYEPTRS